MRAERTVSQDADRAWRYLIVASSGRNHRTTIDAMSKWLGLDKTKCRLVLKELQHNRYRKGARQILTTNEGVFLTSERDVLLSCVNQLHSRISALRRDIRDIVETRRHCRGQRKVRK
jgi:hypothetical protein